MKGKFSPKTYPYVFIGYSNLHKGYRCFHPVSWRVFISRNVVFDELTLPYVKSQEKHQDVASSIHLAIFHEFFTTSSDYDASNSSNNSNVSSSNFECRNVDEEPITSGEVFTGGEQYIIELAEVIAAPNESNQVVVPDESTKVVAPSETEAATSNQLTEAVVPSQLAEDTQPEEVQRRKSQRETKTPSYLGDYVCNAVIAKIGGAYGEPKSVNEALTIPHWYTTMQEELEALDKNETWSLVPRKAGMNVVGSKWVFKIK